jgi:hypothetical protein
MIPVSTKAIEKIVEYLLPWLSTRMFMHKRPINEPTEKRV